MPKESEFSLECPLPISEYPTVQLAHGGGGALMRQLIEKVFVAAFGVDSLESSHDSALLTVPNNRLAFTTDSFVVNPLFFPGGDIGSLAVHGTVNDLASAGARPMVLSTGFILEEGLPMAGLWRIVTSMRRAADEAGVRIVTGDTKVVERGKGDGVYINTSGVGVLDHDLRIHPDQIQPGDAVILNGDLGRHGAAIMAARQDLGFASTIRSDSAALNHLVQAVIKAGVEVHCIRDLTRGGLGSAMNELAGAAQLGIEIEEETIRVQRGVRALCEVLGLDPLYVANEGRLAFVVPVRDADRTLNVLRKVDTGRAAYVCGRVVEKEPGFVMLKTTLGASRILPMLSGEQLPRIC